MEARKRVQSLDAVRGLAVLWMVWFQTFDMFSRDLQLSNMNATGFWFTLFDLFNWLPLFIISSGISMWLMVNREMGKGRSRLRIFVHGTRRYGSYIILSLFLCLWVADLNLFLELGEVVGAIGFYALVSLAVLLIFHNSTLALLMSVWGFSFWLREFISNSGYGVPISPFFIGFTVWLTLPFFFAGIFLSERIVRKRLKALLLFDISLLPLLLLLAYSGNQVSYFLGTLSFIVSTTFYTVLLFILGIIFDGSRITRFLGFFGKHALLFYVSYLAVWFKLATLFNVLRSFDIFASAILTSLSLVAVAVASKLATEIRGKL